MDTKVEGQDLLSVGSVFAALTTYLFWPVWLIVYYVLLYVTIAVIFLAKILYTPVGWLLQPFVYLGRFLLIALWTPFRLLAKLETLYIYLGVAALVGLAIGAAMRYIYGSLSGSLHLDKAVQPSPPARSAKEYRDSKRREKEKATAVLYSPLNTSPQSTSPTQTSQAHYSTSEAALKSRHGKGLLNQTIMEEMDSDY